VFPQDGAVITGTVVDELEAVLPGSVIELKHSTSGEEYQTTTDGEGRFRIAGIVPGDYHLSILTPGFIQDTRELTVAPGESVEIRIIMYPSGTSETITVSSSAGYAPVMAGVSTKTQTPLMEAPRAVTVVSSERLLDLNPSGLQDALNYAAGVRSDAFGLDSRTDSVFVRGGYPDEYLDGMRQLFNYYTSTTRTDPYMLERIEILRGPASMLYGQGTTAGIINQVSKRPRAETEREVGVQFGSFGRKQVQADFTGPLSEDGKWLYRLVALGRKSDTQVDYVPDDRLLFAPSITWSNHESTTVTGQFRFQHDWSGSTLQFFPWSGNVLPNPNGQIPTDRFIGEPGFDRYNSSRLTGGWLFEHRFNSHWTVRQNLRLTRNKVDYRTLYVDSFSDPGDSFLDPEQRMMGRIAWVQKPHVRMLTTDQYAEGLFQTGPFHHQLMAGMDIVRFRQTSESASDFPEHLGGGVPPIDVYNPIYTGYTPPPLEEEPESTQYQTGFYLQDQIEFGSGWIGVAGVRHDRVSNGLEGSETERSRATTSQFGLIHTFRHFAPYVNYSESFTPVAGTDLFGQRFDPLEGKQVELGLKLQPQGSSFAFTAALFDLREENRLIADPDNPLNMVQAGSTQTRGLELEFLGAVLPELDLSAHYNYLNNDEQLDALPKHQAALWGRKQFRLGDIEGLSAAVGLRYFSSFKDGIAPRVPRLTLVDAMLAWENADWRYSLNINNLADRTYVSTCLPRGDCFYGARRSISLSIFYRY